jgi:hypothetical protein
MAIAETESKALEMQLKYEIEEKERRDWEQAEIELWEAHVRADTEEWSKRTKEYSRVVSRKNDTKLLVEAIYSESQSSGPFDTGRSQHLDLIMARKR